MERDYLTASAKPQPGRADAQGGGWLSGHDSVGFDEDDGESGEEEEDDDEQGGGMLTLGGEHTGGATDSDESVAASLYGGAGAGALEKHTVSLSMPHACQLL